MLSGFHCQFGNCIACVPIVYGREYEKRRNVFCYRSACGGGANWFGILDESFRGSSGSPHLSLSTIEYCKELRMGIVIANNQEDTHGSIYRQLAQNQNHVLVNAHCAAYYIVFGICREANASPSSPASIISAIVYRPQCCNLSRRLRTDSVYAEQQWIIRPVTLERIRVWQRIQSAGGH